MSDIKNGASAEVGHRRIAWAKQSMPVLAAIEARFHADQPLAGTRISACLHVTTETAVLAQVLAAGGAEVRLGASNPLSTQDDVAAALSEHEGVDVYAIRGVDNNGYYRHIVQTLDWGPHLTMDDGADLVRMLHTEHPELLGDIRGGTEETTTGVSRLRNMARESQLRFPVIAVNDARTKHLFDNRYGTGQSTIDGILRATNRLLAGNVFVVAGYGWCGRGVAMRAAGMGARVLVTEVEPLKALEATMDGYQVCPMSEAARVGDFFCTVTGNTAVINGDHFALMKDRAIVCNAGHFNVELDLDALTETAVDKYPVRNNLCAYRMPDGRTLYLLAEGRLVNLAAAEGHPSAVMDMSFANQALSAEFLLASGHNLGPTVHDVPDAIDTQIASMKLSSMGISIDSCTPAQDAYQRAWTSGT